MLNQSVQTGPPAGGNTGRLFLMFGGPVCADWFSTGPHTVHSPGGARWRIVLRCCLDNLTSWDLFRLAHALSARNILSCETFGNL